jgi:hypothetical protein
MSLSAKKFDRYILPVFLILDITAAIGIIALIDFILENSMIKNLSKINKIFTIFEKKNKTKLVYLLIGVILIIRGLVFFSLHPNYLAYYNPIVGGSSKAPDIIFVGIGEGLKEAADYLNQKPNANEMLVASWNGSEFTHFFKGKAIMLELFDKSNPVYEGTEEIPNEVDYIVLYINQIQRNLVPQVIEKYYKKIEPEYIVKINGINYAWIYKNT